MSADSANCFLHPDRVAQSPCVRCGTFLCDWCLKLTPSWGPGLCAECQKRRKVPRVTRFRMTSSRMIVLAPLVLLALGSMRALILSIVALELADSAIALAMVLVFGGLSALLVRGAMRG